MGEQSADRCWKSEDVGLGILSGQCSGRFRQGGDSGRKNATEVSASYDGTLIAYTNDNGDIFKMNLNDMKEEENQFGQRAENRACMGSRWQQGVFPEGEKLDAISAITVATKISADVLADKVAYKSDLYISPSGKRRSTRLPNAGTTDATTLAVSAKGTEPQIYRLDLTQKGAKPVKMTSSLDNKSYSVLAESGSVIYLSTDPGSPGNKSVVRTTSSDGKSSNVLVEVNAPVRPSATPDGNAWCLTVNADGKQMVYNVAARAERF